MDHAGERRGLSFDSNGYAKTTTTTHTHERKSTINARPNLCFRQRRGGSSLPHGQIKANSGGRPRLLQLPRAALNHCHYWPPSSASPTFPRNLQPLDAAGTWCFMAKKRHKETGRELSCTLYFLRQEVPSCPIDQLGTQYLNLQAHTPEEEARTLRRGPDKHTHNRGSTVPHPASKQKSATKSYK